MDERAYQYEIAGLKARVIYHERILWWQSFISYTSTAAVFIVALLFWCIQRKTDEVLRANKKTVNYFEARDESFRYSIYKRFEKLEKNYYSPEPQEQ